MFAIDSFVAGDGNGDASTEPGMHAVDGGKLKSIITIINISVVTVGLPVTTKTVIKRFVHHRVEMVDNVHYLVSVNAQMDGQAIAAMELQHALIISPATQATARDLVVMEYVSVLHNFLEVLV